MGIPSENIEDAYILSYQVERRVAFQAWVQKWVDHGISSTINLPYQIKEDWEVEDFKTTLMKYLPQLRGVTCYPDGCRAGQPITPVPLEYALQNEGVIVETNEESCKGGICSV
jgi:ribonucleoside-diphosphate reductase alpha chain